MTEWTQTVISASVGQSIEVGLARALQSYDSQRQLALIERFFDVSISHHEEVLAVTNASWNFLEKHQLWRHSAATLKQYKDSTNHSERVAPWLMEFKKSSEQKLASRVTIIHQWGTAPEDLLSEEQLPATWSRDVLAQLARLSKRIRWNIAKPLIDQAINERVVGVRANQLASRQTQRRNPQSIIMPADIRAVFCWLNAETGTTANSNAPTSSHSAGLSIAEGANASASAVLSEGEATEGINSAADDRGHQSSNPFSSHSLTHRSAAPTTPVNHVLNTPRQLVYCSKCRIVQDKIILKLKEKPETEGQAIRMLEHMKTVGLDKLCHEHVRSLAGNYFGLRNNKHGSNRELLQKLNTVYKYRDDLSCVRRQRASWFRRDPASKANDKDSSPYMWKPKAEETFSFDARQVFNRFAGRADAWDVFQRDGTINLKGFFDHLTAAKVFELVEQEYNMYKYHERDEINGKSRLGWIRGMFYSCTQQVTRQDPGWWAMMAAARPDQNWMLISYPYYTKDTVVGEGTGFAHFDINIKRHAKTHYANSMIQSSLSLDDETNDNCTLIVKGFQHHFDEWFPLVETRGKAAGGHTTNASNIYPKQDSDRFGRLEPVPCGRGGIRISRSDLLHASTSRASIRRRTLFAWHDGIRKDHETLDVEESETWSELSACHSGFIAPRKSSSGEGFRYGRPTSTFPGTHRLGFSSHISTALVGGCRWDEADVMAERNILLGPDDAAALELLASIRQRLIENFKAAVPKALEAERRRFGEKSFSLNSLSERPAPDDKYFLASDEESIEDAPLPPINLKSKRKAKGKGKGSMKKRRRGEREALDGYSSDAQNMDLNSNSASQSEEEDGAATRRESDAAEGSGSEEESGLEGGSVNAQGET